MVSKAMIRLFVLSCLMLACSLGTPAIATDLGELCDTYFFLSDDDTVTGSDRAKITGLAGSVVEVRNDSYRIDRGVITVTTKRTPLNLVFDVVSLVVPANSTVTVKLNSESAVVTANQVGNNGNITLTANGQTALLSSGQTIPNTASPLAACVPNRKSKPLLVIGRDVVCELTERDHTLSLTNGRMYFCTPSDIKIETPMGLVTAPAQSQFYLISSEGFLRLLCCRGHGLRYNYKSKFRRVGVAEEFSVWDHRPIELEVVPPDGIGRKDVSLIDLDGKQLTAAKSVFSVVSLLKSPSYLGDWKRLSPLDRRLEDNMLRTAAAYAAANPSATNFQQTAPLFSNTTDTRR